MIYRVHCRHRDTQKTFTIEIEAASEEEAVREAGKRQMQVIHIERLSAASRPALESPPSPPTQPLTPTRATADLLHVLAWVCVAGSVVYFGITVGMLAEIGGRMAARAVAVLFFSAAAHAILLWGVLRGLAEVLRVIHRMEVSAQARQE